MPYHAPVRDQVKDLLRTYRLLAAQRLLKLAVVVLPPHGREARELEIALHRYGCRTVDWAKLRARDPQGAALAWEQYRRLHPEDFAPADREQRRDRPATV